MNTIHLWMILAYMLVLALVGFKSRRKVESQEDFAVAGRELSAFVLFGTLLATWVGTGSIFGNAEKTYRVGLAALILPLASVCGMAILYLIAARVRGLKQITVQDLLEKRYNPSTRLFGALTLVVAYTTIVSYQYRAATGILNLVIPQLPIQAVVLLSAAFVIAYTVMAGMFSIAYIGVVQGVTMIVGIAVALPVFWAMLICINGSSARSQGVARKAALWTVAGVAFMESMIILAAWMASSLEPDLEIHGWVIVSAARNHLPPFLGALVLTATMAIVLSTASSYLLSPATCVVRDLYQRFLNPEAPEASLVFLLRASVVALGAIVCYFSTLSDEFLSVALLAYTLYGAGITPALLAAFFWKRATSACAVTSIALGTAVTLAWKAFGILVVDAVVPAIGVSIASLVLVSLWTSPPPREKVAPFFPAS